MSDKAWNRCDICGKFIPIKDFDLGKARRVMTTPDSDFSSESYETTCKKRSTPKLHELIKTT